MKGYRGGDVDLIKFKKKVVKHRYDIKTLFGIDINPVASAIAIAKLLTTMGQKLNLICRDKLKNSKAGHRVYIFSPISETNIRHEILQNWLKVDARVTLLDGVTGFIHQVEIGGWYLIGKLSDISQGFGRWVQLQDIAAIAYV